MIEQIGLFAKTLIEGKYKYLLLLTLVIVVARLGSWFYPFENDHLFFYVIGREIAEGKILYLDIWDHKPPLIYYFNALIHIFLGGSILVHRIFFTMWMLVELFCFYSLLKLSLEQVKNKHIIFTARLTLIFYAFWRNLSQFAYSGNNTENFGLIFLIGLYYFGLKFLEKRRSIWIFLCGLCLSVLFFLKPNFIIFSLPLWVEIFYPWLNIIQKKDWSKFWENLKSSLLNSLLLISPTIVQGVFWVWYFHTQGALWEFWIASYEFSHKYVAEFFNYIERYEFFIFINFQIILYFLIFFALFVHQNWSNLVKEGHHRFMFLGGLVGIVVCLSFLGFFPYYFLILAPIVFLIQAQTNINKINHFVRNTILMVLTLNTLIAFASSIAFSDLIDLDKKRLEYLKLEKISNFVNSDPEKSLYSLDFGTTFYFLTKKNNVTNIVSANVIEMDEHKNFGYNFYSKIMADLEEDKTNYIIADYKYFNSIASIRNYIESCYEVKQIIEPHIIFERKESC